MAYKEGDIVTNDKGDQFKLTNNQWVHISPSDNPSKISQTTSPSQKATDIALGGVQKFLNGLTFGWAGQLQNEMDKEMQGLGNKPITNKTGDQLAAEYQKQAGAIPSFGLETAGMLANPVSRLAGRATEASPILGSSLFGGAMGASMGAGGAQPGSRLMGAGIGATSGAVLGPIASYGSRLAAQKLLPAIVRGTSNLSDLVKPSQLSASQKANALIRPYLQQSFNSPQEAQAALAKLGQQATLMDLSPEMAGAGSAAYNLGIGNMKSASNQLFDTRNTNAIDRITKGLDNTFGGKVQGIGKFIKDTMQQRTDQAGPLFDAARSMSVPEQTVSQYSAGLDDLIQKTQGTPFARSISALKKALYKKTPDGKVLKTSVDELQYPRKMIGDAAAEAWRSGKKDLWKFLTGVRDGFDQIMPKEYQQANQIFYDKSSILDAADYGKKFFQPNTKSYDLMDWLSNANENEKIAYITGMTQAAKDKMGNMVNNAKVSRIFNTPEARTKLEAVVGSPQAANQFINDIERENVFKATQNLVSGNSFTAARTEAMNQFKNLIGDINSQDIGSKYDIIRQAARKLTSALKVETGMNKALANSFVKKLTQQGLTPKTLEQLMSSPVREVTQRVLADFGPQSGIGGLVAGVNIGNIGQNSIQNNMNR